MVILGPASAGDDHILLRTNVGYRQAVDQDMHDVVDNDDQPGRHPGWRVGMKPGGRTFGPGSAARPRPIFHPRNVARQVPAIDNEVRAANNG